MNTLNTIANRKPKHSSTRLKNTSLAVCLAGLIASSVSTTSHANVICEAGNLFGLGKKSNCAVGNVVDDTIDTVSDTAEEVSNVALDAYGLAHALEETITDPEVLEEIAQCGTDEKCLKKSIANLPGDVLTEEVLAHLSDIAGSVLYDNEVVLTSVFDLLDAMNTDLPHLLAGLEDAMRAPKMDEDTVLKAVALLFEAVRQNSELNGKATGMLDKLKWKNARSLTFSVAAGLSAGVAAEAELGIAIDLDYIAAVINGEDAYAAVSAKGPQEVMTVYVAPAVGLSLGAGASAGLGIGYSSKEAAEAGGASMNVSLEVAFILGAEVSLGMDIKPGFKVEKPSSFMIYPKLGKSLDASVSLSQSLLLVGFCPNWTTFGSITYNDNVPLDGLFLPNTDMPADMILDKIDDFEGMSSSEVNSLISQEAASILSAQPVRETVEDMASDPIGYFTDLLYESVMAVPDSFYQGNEPLVQLGDCQIPSTVNPYFSIVVAVL